MSFTQSKQRCEPTDMDHARSQDTQQSKGSTLRHREHSDETVDKRPTDSSASPIQDEKRLIRRVRSPSRPRAWLSNSYKPKFGGRVYRPRFSRDDHSFYKPGFSSQRYHHFSPQDYSHRRDHFPLNLHHVPQRERDREKEERYEQRESADGSSPPKQNTSTRTFLPRSTSSRDKDMQFTVCQNDKNQSRERDHRGTKSKERERSRDGELPSTASQTVTRERAIQQKRREIDEMYYQECEMFGLVAKMLIAKDQSLEGPIQSSLQENLRDIGKRCVDAMEKFIEDYDSRELSH
ncbi:serine/arginine repetitive matrix protein 5 isoform X1 [Micropterus dolomieu]|uniref:serine/arginine repetitive matrix protein 5 isoform X1 n=2 Tax=Micropterus dolomieu TaxID=147949 RepID=UPI001E8D23C7|nr:serine/arginine repetitive matrix protein 5 isoform X1 [Micropterus dolomieu]